VVKEEVPKKLEGRKEEGRKKYFLKE